jgi:hypothetical protein
MDLSYYFKFKSKPNDSLMEEYSNYNKFICSKTQTDFINHLMINKRILNLLKETNQIRIKTYQDTNYKIKTLMIYIFSQKISLIH